MIKTLKLLQSSNRLTLTNVPKLKTQLQTILKAFKPFKIEFKCKDEKAFFEACIHYQGLVNKLAFESVFEAQRYALLDIWNHLTYQEKNRLVHIKLNEVKDGLKYFKTQDDKVIWIPFFDRLLNALYHNDLAIFELEQYYRLYRDFKGRRTNIHDYGLLPYQSGFIEVTPLYTRDNAFYFYEQNFKSIFCIVDETLWTRIPLSKSVCQVHPLQKDLLVLCQAHASTREIELAQILVQSPCVDDKCKKKLEKHLSKLTKVVQS